jgi:hypothetical protein
MDKKLQDFLERDKKYTSNQWKELWAFRAVRESLGLPLDKDRYDMFLSGGRTSGNTHFKGAVVGDGSIVCEKCASKDVFAGSYSTEHESVMYSELGGTDDASNYWIDTTQFYVCLDCEYMGTRGKK